MGENGAGKSTLMKILAGAYYPDSGEIILDGKTVHFRTPHEARLAGIGIIYQELTVAPNLTVSGNVFLGSELKRFGFMTDTAEMDRKTQEVLNRLGARFKATQRAAHLAVAEALEQLGRGEGRARAAARRHVAGLRLAAAPGRDDRAATPRLPLRERRPGRDRETARQRASAENLTGKVDHEPLRYRLVRSNLRTV